MIKGRQSLGSLLIVLMLLPVAIIACSNNTDNGDEYASRGIDAYDAGRFDEAIVELEQAIEAGVTRHEMEEIYTILGNTYDNLDLYDEAIDAHMKALELDPDYFQAWVNLGITYRHKGDLDRAEESYNKALNLEPDYAELHASIGALDIFKGEPEKAIVALERAIELDSQLAVAHANLALAYAMVGLFEEAEASLQQAIILGYENSVVIQERIDNLKAIQD
jgi:tetratricopeptide (TPR) repeat protein